MLDSRLHFDMFRFMSKEFETDFTNALSHLTTNYPAINLRQVIGVEVGSAIEFTTTFAGKKMTTEMARHYTLSSSDQYEQHVGAFLNDDGRVRGEREVQLCVSPHPQAFVG